ncbi:MAG TPA: DsbA family oxidoreductase [Solirubrobacterales bacterium]|jgi:predicted DsbA family dithiol-disulfide isomerase
MKVEVFSDVVCPWCFLGKRRLEAAVADFDGTTEVTWRAFQLQPDAPRFGEPGAGELSLTALQARGYAPEQIEEQGRLTALAAEEGLDYALDRAHHVNSFDAHRLAKAAARHGRADEMVERLFRAQLVEALRVDDPAVLARLAAEVGVPPGTPAEDEADAAAVIADLEEGQAIGVNGVPFFVLDRRFAVSGAQPTELLGRALVQAATERESSADSSV